jgi:hypothetical protein
VLLGAYLESVMGSHNITKTFTIGVSLSIFNLLPLFFCFMIDKILNKVDDEDFGIITSVKAYSLYLL